MFQKIDPTVITRIFIPLLFAPLVVAPSGCTSDERTNVGAGHNQFAMGGYRGNETLAMLLPKSGCFAQAAETVRAGIVAAQKADPQKRRPKLRFYDSTADSIIVLVRQAAADGATLAIGPLQKPALEELAGLSVLPIPVLAMNQLSVAIKPRNLYQFALAPESEVATVVDEARAKRYRRAVILYPENDWGDRMVRAFHRQWKTRGGIIVATQAFDPLAEDFSDTVERLSKRVARPDFVFLVATSKLAHKIWPWLRDDIAKRVPIYSTSHIYSGRFDPKSDKNLVGLNFVEIPWLIKPTRGDAVSSIGLKKDLPRLYAMGVDAYRLGSRLNWMSRNRRARVQGKTGVLSMDSQRRIHRMLTPAHISTNGPRSYWRSPGRRN